MIQSRFFTVDLAQTDSGQWLIVDLGDGQVAGLREHVDMTEFYGRLISNMARPTTETAWHCRLSRKPIRQPRQRLPRHRLNP